MGCSLLKISCWLPSCWCLSSVQLSIYRTPHQHIHMSIHCDIVHLFILITPICPSLHLYIHMSIHCPSIHPYVNPSSICPSLHLYIHVNLSSIWTSFCQSVRLFIYTSICLSISTSIFLYIVYQSLQYCTSICLSSAHNLSQISKSIVSLSLHLHLQSHLSLMYTFFHLSLHLFLYLYIHLSLH